MPQYTSVRRLAQGEMPTSATAVLTLDTVQRGVVSSISFTNMGASSCTVNMWVVPSGMAVENANQFLCAELYANQSYRESQLGLVMEPGDTIHLEATEANVAYFISGAYVYELE